MFPAPQPRQRPTPPDGHPGVVPPGWPRQVRPPDAPDWEATAAAWLLDLCPPDYRRFPGLRRHVVVLARFAVLHVEAQQAATRRGLSEIREKVAANEAQAPVGWMGGGLGLLGVLMGGFAAFRSRGTSKALPIPERFQLPGNPILNAAANLPQIPGTVADDVARVIAQRIQAVFAPAQPPAAA